MSRLYKFHHDETPAFLESLGAREELEILADDKEYPQFSCNKVSFHLRLPLFYPQVEPCEPLWHYLKRVEFPEKLPQWNILLMEAGRAAVGSVLDKELINHKNFRRYMVRKKSGKAQLTHLKTKGKSRYGSRLRLQESEAFFREIIERLSQTPEKDAPFIFYHCPVRLKAFLDEAAEGVEELQHFCWRRLGVNVKESSFDELQRLSLGPLYSRLTLEQKENVDKLPPIPEYKK